MVLDKEARKVNVKVSIDMNSIDTCVIRRSAFNAGHHVPWWATRSPSTLAENPRAWGDYAFVPQRMQGVVRDKIDLSVDLLGLRQIIITPFGSHGLHYPLAEVATARGKI